jgi:hypothetical protein
MVGSDMMDMITEAHSWLDTSLLAAMLIQLTRVSMKIDEHEKRLTEIEKRV